MKRDAYKKAGVDVDAGEALVSRIAPLAASTHRAEVIGGLGGFGGLFALGRYRDPVLVSGTDGVGTKLLVAQQLGRHQGIGVDLVAMCVNDIAVSGAEPLFFLDYYATGRLEPDVAAEVIAGIADGCRQAGCALLGGETAEMPGMYAPGHYDLAGFAVGVVERDALIDGSSVRAGDALVGVPSSGLHANGYSLVRQVLDGVDLTATEPRLGHPLAHELLRPTRIYVGLLRDLRARFDVRAVAHVTGGGLPGNLPRVLPSGLGAVVRRDAWALPPIFGLLQERGGLSDDDLLGTLNCGIGLVVVVPPEQAPEVARESGGAVIGQVVEGEGLELR